MRTYTRSTHPTSAYGLFSINKPNSSPPAVRDEEQVEQGRLLRLPGRLPPLRQHRGVPTVPERPPLGADPPGALLRAPLAALAALQRHQPHEGVEELGLGGGFFLFRVQGVGGGGGGGSG